MWTSGDWSFVATETASHSPRGKHMLGMFKDYHGGHCSERGRMRGRWGQRDVGGSNHELRSQTWILFYVIWEAIGEFLAKEWYDLVEIFKEALWLLCWEKMVGGKWEIGETMVEATAIIQVRLAQTKELVAEVGTNCCILKLFWG